MRTALILGVAAFALTACNTAVGTDVARQSAKSVVNGVVDRQFPGVPVTPVTDCVIDNATGGEIVQIAGDAARQQASPETVTLVLDIATRPDTISCFVDEAGPQVLPFIIAGGR